jgi:N-acetylmuramoyl-L-alanine amidase
MIRNVLIVLLAAFSSVVAREGPLASYVNSQTESLATIVLYVGHGGTDLGARAKPPYCEEKKLCLQTARLVKKHLNQLGYHVVMTRESDAFVSLPRRVEIANQAGGDLFVSVHFNSTRNPTAQGIEVFFYDSREDRPRASSSRKLAEAVLSRIIRRTEAVSRGVKRGNFFVIRESSMPAILVEGGFISNPEERAQLRTREYQEKIAMGIADGIDRFMKKH